MKICQVSITLFDAAFYNFAAISKTCYYIIIEPCAQIYNACSSDSTCKMSTSEPDLLPPTLQAVGFQDMRQQGGPETSSRLYTMSLACPWWSGKTGSEPGSLTDIAGGALIALIALPVGWAGVGCWRHNHRCREITFIQACPRSTRTLSNGEKLFGKLPPF